MSPVNRGRLLRALLERVVVNDALGTVELHLAHLEDVDASAVGRECARR
jgi:hypothetical protein